jgi:hypothetical protein
MSIADEAWQATHPTAVAAGQPLSPVTEALRAGLPPGHRRAPDHAQAAAAAAARQALTRKAPP